MAFQLSLVNGVNKYGQGNELIYLFNGITIIADTTNDSMIIVTTNQSINYSNPMTVQYADITDKLGSADIEEYVDALATDGYFV